MIIQCPSCRALVDVRHVVVDHESARAGLTCRECERVTWLGTSQGEEEGPKPTSSALAPLEATTADKKTDSTTMLVDVDAAKAAVLKLDLPAEAEETRLAFVTLFDTWENEEAHKKVLSRALISGQIAIIGQAYRTVLETVSDDNIALKDMALKDTAFKDMALKGRERVLAAAMVQMTELPAADHELTSTRKTLTIVAAIACAIIVGICGYYIFTVTLPQLMDPDGMGDLPLKSDVSR